MDRRTFLGAGLAGLGLASTGANSYPPARADEAGGGELLYNGIRLPSVWPPGMAEVPSTPVTPAYLNTPPAVIPIDVGRQLFVDDFLVEKTTLDADLPPGRLPPE